MTTTTEVISRQSENTTRRREKQMTSMTAPICIDCKHFVNKDWSCKAFPEGIPQEILVGIPYKDNPGYNRFEHTRPYPGDHGILFEPM
jgi:hypothetical protein